MTTLTGIWTLDNSHSEAGFTVRHAGISKVRGSFTVAEATVNHDGSAGQVIATLDATSFTTGNDQRDEHIKSADFLDVTVHPTLDFKGVYANNELVGDLTIHGVTKPVTFTVEDGGEAVDPYGNVRRGVEASTTISRKDFGLTWNAALETGGVLVSDKVKIELDLSFIKTS